MKAVAGGVVWALVYNAVWVLAWLAFMRAEWFGTGARTEPWGIVWTVWTVLSLVLGISLSAYLATRPRRAAVSASIVLWVPLTLGMVAWASQTSMSLRVAILDSLVNLVALLVASLTTAAVLRAVTPVAAA